MSDALAIRLANVGKMYKVFSGPLHNLLNALGLEKVFSKYGSSYREFWALRDISLELKQGQRIGIIGRNGAGKSTLLKLITRNLPCTEGELLVQGRVDALMAAGAGFHPEFTGYENIRASLTYQGLNHAEIERAVQDIEEFTELGHFLNQMFKTYSSGMQARLTFATATAIKPDILIVDEILGAGDGYFFQKSTERMSRLVEEMGATVLLVSHGLDQIARFCEETVWLDRGRIVQHGPSMEVIKAYQEYLNLLNERRLKSKNRLRQKGRTGAAESGYYTDNLVVTFQPLGHAGARVDVSELALREYQEVLQCLRIGDAQDSTSTLPAFVLLDDNRRWSSPQRSRNHRYRSVTVNGDAPNAGAQAVFYLYGMHENLDYAMDVTYRVEGGEAVEVTVIQNGQVLTQASLPTDQPLWQTYTISLPKLPSAGGEEEEEEEDREGEHPRRKATALRKWQGDDSLAIESVILLNENDQEQALFAVGSSMKLRMIILARDKGTYPVIPVAVIYRSDGIVVSQHWGELGEFGFAAGDRRKAELSFGPLNFGNGTYLISVGVYRKLSLHNLNEAEPYEIIDRSYEFEIFGNPARMNAVFRHPGEWGVV